MIYSLETHKWISDQKKCLGFVGINLFTLPIDGFNIMQAVHSGLLNDHHFSREIPANCPPTANYGSIIISKLEESDFKEVGNEGLKSYFREFWAETNWGQDLDVFKKHKQQTDEYLSSIEFTPVKHYFLCKNWLTTDKLTHDDFFNIWSA